MDIRPGIRAALLADAAVAAIAGDRVYSMLAPQGERRPCIVFVRVSEIEDATLKGAQGIAQSRVQIDCWAETPDQANALAEAVRARMQGLSGTFAGAVFCGAWADRINEGQDRETLAWRVSRDFRLMARAA